MNLSFTVPGLTTMAPLTLVMIHASKRSPLAWNTVTLCDRPTGFSPAGAFNVITDPAGIESCLGDLDDEPFVKATPEPAVLKDEVPTYSRVVELVNEVKLRHGVQQARHVIAAVGGANKLMSIDPERFTRVVRACRWLLVQPTKRDPWIYLMLSDGTPA